MPVRLNTQTHLAPFEPGVVPPGVDPSVEQIRLGPLPLDGLNARKHGHNHVHHQDSVPDATGDDTEDADPDCGDDDSCDVEENQIHIS